MQRLIILYASFAFMECKISALAQNFLSVWVIIARSVNAGLHRNITR